MLEFPHVNTGDSKKNILECWCFNQNEHFPGVKASFPIFRPLYGFTTSCSWQQPSARIWSPKLCAMWRRIRPRAWLFGCFCGKNIEIPWQMMDFHGELSISNNYLFWLDGRCFFWVLLHEFSYEYEWICWRLAESCWVSSKCSSHEWRQRTMRNHKDNGWVIKPLMEWRILLRWQLRLGSWIPGPGEW